METRICSKCKEEKTLDNFSKKGNGYSYYCKECNKEYMKIYYETKKNDEEFKQKRKQYSDKYVRPQNSIDKHKEKTKEWRLKNKSHIREYAKKYDNEHKEEKIRNYNNWKKNNKDKIKEYQQRDYKKRMSNPKLKLELQLRNLINNSFKKRGQIKSYKLELICGMRSKDLVDYLNKTFKNNYGYEWDGIEKVHIDHIIPLKTAQTEGEVIKLCHYTNLQLLKAQDNLKKGSKLI